VLGSELTVNNPWEMPLESVADRLISLSELLLKANLATRSC